MLKSFLIKLEFLLKKWLRRRCLPVNVANFFKKSIFYGTSPVTAYMSIRIGRRGRCGRKEPEKNFRRKEENENISFNFYQQLLVLAISEMQIQLYKY